jgi:trans-2,3-dihydro-3-hydroxyanthranilate isomerase
MARFRYVLVDVFTDTPLQGNPLAVFTDARDIPEDKLQSIAREMNLSETVFVYPPGWPIPTKPQGFQDETGSGGPLDRDNDEETTFVYPPDGDGHVRVRILTPGVELPFAGHPLLGTAVVLGGPLQLIEIRLETGKGTIPIVLEREGARIVSARMRQPVPTIQSFPQVDELLAALGGVESQLPVELYDNGVPHVYVALGSRDEVAALRPNMGALEQLGAYGFNCFAGEGTKWKTRMFGIGVGVTEDPATGSAAGPLALHLVRHGRVSYGDELEIVQGEEIQRRSILYATAHSPEHIEVAGSAVIVARGEFQL